MTEMNATFLASAEEKLGDYRHRENTFVTTKRYNGLASKAKQQFSNLEAARERVASIRWKTFESLDKYLIEFEAGFTRNGGKLLWAQDAIEALNEVLSILSKKKIKRVVKSKSMTSEEINLEKVLVENNVECVESDLGEFILQLSGDKPSHMVTPAAHKSLDEITAMFKDKFSLEGNPGPEQLSDYTRSILREKFKKAGASITGANFLLADTGSIGITENEGNVLMGMSFPKIQIVIAGIDKILPSVNDLDLFFPLLATHGTGQDLTAYNSLITGPRTNGEKDGPEEIYLVLIDNGRSSLLAKQEQRSAINCIRCGACLTACPVYNVVGGHAYRSVYSGPIGSVILPHQQNKEENKHLSYASTICGKCTEVCPVKIELHKLLLYNRKDFRADKDSKAEKIAYYFWKKAMLKRELMNKGGSRTKNFVIRNFFGKGWGTRREMPRVAPKSFNERWQMALKLR